jgi:hypothetical protein
MTTNDRIKTQASCADDFDPDTLSAEQAEHRIEALIRPVGGCEKIAVRSALNRTLAEDVYSTVNVPAHNNSASTERLPKTCIPLLMYRHTTIQPWTATPSAHPIYQQMTPPHR